MTPLDDNDDNREQRLGRFAEILASLSVGQLTLAEAVNAVQRARDEPGFDAVELSAAVERAVAAGELPELAAAALLGTASPATDAATRLRPSLKPTDTGRDTRHEAKPAFGTGRPRTDAASWAEPSGPAPRLGVGDVLRDRFVIESVIGEGGMSVVFRARDRRREEALDRNPCVAIKVLGDELKSHPDALIALQREARRMQQLSHPHIASVHDFDRDGAHVYLVMELLEGDALDGALARNPGTGLPPEQARRVIEQAGRALRHAHSRGVVHSDFKPANVFLTRQGEVKVIDFGIARIAKDSTQADSSLTVFDAGRLGAYTNAYASPEQILGTEDPHPKDDVYSFGLVVYEALTGRHPFGSKSAVEARFLDLKVEPVPGLSTQQNARLAAALAFDRKDRLENVSLLVEAFAVNDEPIIPMRDRLHRRPGSDGKGEPAAGGRRNQWLVLLAVVGVAGLLLYALNHRNMQPAAGPPAAGAPAATVAMPTVVPAEPALVAPSTRDAQQASSPAAVAAAPAKALVASKPAAAGLPAATRSGSEQKKAAGSSPAAPSDPAVPDRQARQSREGNAAAATAHSPPASGGAGDGTATPAPGGAEASLYRWVDNQGNVQFGATPPAEYADVAVKVVDF